ncbi:uncharacterized protein MONOS_785 [Monocercomonoides exilis]|uniref:uncharacterized protein n=1 Tax=Monocercomonoides exilis TaxID=2049356 RepID=UPI003559A0E9|nr:hypothetical protein MONOS_785 [Monocercomonoides exilis]|eukprot:MONOS_785.1-p1 / transcript=MONOS_785.1 / gene=MONOS_785 / organism=Monocercomonoides_exilis_PA203 / gene_product=unspecified product / transcript_product=unspecified product / location=Mono_scaffold00013:105445-116095(-) / protein_length=3157 / sequence_SO=supercontig / SO=protein_coding / is_pseudo=false
MENETKEMAIGSLKEREQTASQILFWVANLALHSFDEMDNPLQSLANLSPHIVLFSEHMVICVVMHSDFLSSDDSDSSSASSITIVSSSSNISVLSERYTDSPPPSSAFEDDEDRIKKESLRWKAPELQMNKKMGATKESVVFSIGMMLWECLTLEIPFGEYMAETAGDKIVNGERPGNGAERESSFLILTATSFSLLDNSLDNIASCENGDLYLVNPRQSFIDSFSSLIEGCIFSSVYDALDGAIVRPLHSQCACFAVFNSSFFRNQRVTNLEASDEVGNPRKLLRQNVTSNEDAIFNWCEWSNCQAIGSTADSFSSTCGGAISCFSLESLNLRTSNCFFFDCSASLFGGAVLCDSIAAVSLINSSFTGCKASDGKGGGVCIHSISGCVSIERCNFTSCSTVCEGGGAYLDYFSYLKSECKGAEEKDVTSNFMSECFFVACSVGDSEGGGLSCSLVPVTFRISSICFESCSALSKGGGLHLVPLQESFDKDNKMCFFLFFQQCLCSPKSQQNQRNSQEPYGHDVYLEDNYDLHSSSPFVDSYTTNKDDERVCYASGAYDLTFYTKEKKSWLLDLDERNVSASGADSSALCGMGNEQPCKTVGYALSVSEMCSINMASGNYVSEKYTIAVGDKVISIRGNDMKDTVITTNALLPVDSESPTSSSSSESLLSLFSVASGSLWVMSLSIYHNSILPSSPLLFAMESESGHLFLSEVLLTIPSSHKQSRFTFTSPLFLVFASRLNFVDVTVSDMSLSECVIQEALLAPSTPEQLIYTPSTKSDAQSLSTSIALSNITASNIIRSGGNGVLLSRTVGTDEAFSLSNITLDHCNCSEGNGGGIDISLSDPSGSLRIGSSGADSKFSACSAAGYGGGVYLFLSDNCEDAVLSSLEFEDCKAALGGEDVFVNGSSFTTQLISDMIQIETGTHSFSSLMGCDRSLSFDEAIPLAVFLETFEPPAHVGSPTEGKNREQCGYEFFPCLTIGYAVEARFSEANPMILIDEGFVLCEVVRIEAFKWNIYSKESGRKIEVISPQIEKPSNQKRYLTKQIFPRSSSQAMINALVYAKITDLTFSLPSTLDCMEAFFKCEGGGLEIVKCSAMKSNKASNEEWSFTLFDVVGGSLSLSAFQFHGPVYISSSSLIECTETCLLHCASCIFESITKLSGDGGCINIRGSKRSNGEKEISLENCTFKDCSVKSGKSYGGALFASLNVEKKLIVNDTSLFSGCLAPSEDNNRGKGGGCMILVNNELSSFKFSSAVLFSSSHPNNAFWGKDLFVACGADISLRQMVSPSSLEFLDTVKVPKDVQRLSGSEKSEESLVIPLCAYVCELKTILVEGGAGVDVPYCGFSSFKCKTVDYSVEKRFSVEDTSTVTVESNSVLQNELSFQNKQIYLIANSVGMKVTVIDKGTSNNLRALLSCETTVHAENITFILPKVLANKHESFISSSFALGLVSTSFTVDFTKPSIAYSFINIVSGDVSLKNFILDQSITLTVSSFLVINTANVVSIENCSFKQIQKENESGGAILMKDVADESSSILISNCSISSSCVNGAGLRGGGMSLTLLHAASLTIKDICFNCCTIPSTDNSTNGRGLGGGLYLFISDDFSEFQFSNLTYNSCLAWKGKDLFVSAKNFSELIPQISGWVPDCSEPSQFDVMMGFERGTTGECYFVPLCVYFWNNFTKVGYADGTNGGDFSSCGYKQAPCNTVSCLISNRFTPFPLTGCNITIVNSAALTVAMNVASTSYLSFNGAQDTASVVITDAQPLEQQSFFYCTAPIHFNKLVLSIPHSLREGRDSLFHCYSTSLSMSSILMKVTQIPKKCGYTIFSAVNSSLHLMMFNVTDMSFDLSFLSVYSTECVLDLCTFTHLNMSASLLKASRASSLVLYMATLSNLELSSDSVILIEDSNQDDPSTYSENCNHNSLSHSTNEGVSSNKSPYQSSNGEDSAVTISFMWSIVQTVQQSSDGAAVIRSNADSFPVTATINNSSINSVTSTQSNQGGAILFTLNDGADFTVEQSIFTGCVTRLGRGGAIFLDCTSSINDYLPFLLSLVTFTNNNAIKGRDVYVKCCSIQTQINEKQFLLDFRHPYNQTDSIWGVDETTHTTEMDLLLLVVVYRSEVVFVSSTAKENSDGKQCGTNSAPCTSFNVGVSRVMASSFSQLIIIGKTPLCACTKVSDMVLKSSDNNVSSVDLDSSNQFSEASLIRLSSSVKIERLSFCFHSSFSCSEGVLLDGVEAILEMQHIQFTSGADSVYTQLTFNVSLIALEGGTLTLRDCSISSLFLQPSLINVVQSQSIKLLGISISGVSTEDSLLKASLTSELLVINGTCSDFSSDSSSLYFSDVNVVSLYNMSFNNAENIGSLFQFSSCSAYAEHLNISNIDSFGRFMTFADCNNVSLYSARVSSCSSQGSFIDISAKSLSETDSQLITFILESVVINDVTTKAKGSLVCISASQTIVNCSNITIERNKIESDVLFDLLKCSALSLSHTTISHSSSLADSSLIRAAAPSTPSPAAPQEVSVDSIIISSCNMSQSKSFKSLGSMLYVSSCNSVALTSNVITETQQAFSNLESSTNKNADLKGDQLCKWNTSFLHFSKSVVNIRDTTISDTSGALSVFGGSVTLEKSEFYNNAPFIDGYTGIKRNILCSNMGTVNIDSLKGGDGVKDNSSLWILSDNCTLEGIIKERSSPLFIPKLDELNIDASKEDVQLQFIGSDFVPCNFSFQVVMTVNGQAEVLNFDFESILSESEAIGNVPMSLYNENIYVRLVYENKSETPKYSKNYPLKNTTFQENSTQMSSHSSSTSMDPWTIGFVIVAVSLAIIIIIFIVFALKARHSKKLYSIREMKYREDLEALLSSREPENTEAFAFTLTPQDYREKEAMSSHLHTTPRAKKSSSRQSCGQSGKRSGKLPRQQTQTQHSDQPPQQLSAHHSQRQQKQSGQSSQSAQSFEMIEECLSQNGEPASPVVQPPMLALEDIYHDVVDGIAVYSAVYPHSLASSISPSSDAAIIANNPISSPSPIRPKLAKDHRIAASLSPALAHLSRNSSAASSSSSASVSASASSSSSASATSSTCALTTSITPSTSSAFTPTCHFNQTCGSAGTLNLNASNNSPSHKRMPPRAPSSRAARNQPNRPYSSINRVTPSSSSPPSNPSSACLSANRNSSQPL